MARRAHPWLLLPLAAALAATLILGLRGDLAGARVWAALASHAAALHAAVAAAPLAAGALYAAVYIACVALSLPIGVWLSIAGGLLFGAFAGAVLAVLSATGGAVLLFLLARGALAPLLARRAAPFLDLVRPRLQRDGFSYLLALRLLPLVPFWLVNFAPPLLGMRLAPFAAATLLGIVPLTSVLAGIGAGLGRVLAAGVRPDLSVLRSPQVLLPLAGLALLSLLPVAWRRLRRA